MYKYLITFNEYKTNEFSDLIDAKMSEIKDLVSNFEKYIFHWDIQENGLLHVYLSHDKLKLDSSYVCEMDVEKGYVKENENKRKIKSVEEGLEIIEKSVQGILGVSENGHYDSSITRHSIQDIKSKIESIQNHFDAYSRDSDYSKDHMNRLVAELENVLRPYDKKVTEFIVDKLLFDIPDERLSSEIIKLGDDIMGLYGTEPKQVMEAFDTAFNHLEKYVNNMDNLDDEDSDLVNPTERDSQNTGDEDEFGNSIDFDS